MVTCGSADVAWRQDLRAASASASAMQLCDNVQGSGGAFAAVLGGGSLVLHGGRGSVARWAADPSRVAIRCGHLGQYRPWQRHRGGVEYRLRDVQQIPASVATQDIPVNIRKDI